MAALLAEPSLCRGCRPTAGTGEFRRSATVDTELGILWILGLALRAFHPGASRKEDRWDWLGVLVLGSVLNSRKSR